MQINNNRPPPRWYTTSCVISDLSSTLTSDPRLRGKLPFAMANTSQRYRRPWAEPPSSIVQWNSGINSTLCPQNSSIVRAPYEHAD